MTPLLRVDNIECRFGSRTIIEALSFQVAAGEICCLLGPSGCGKTTLLQAIAGFNPVYRGTIHLESDCIARAGDSLPPEQRGIGMVFQDYALFPHLTVRDNIGFGLRSLARSERGARIEEALALVQMEALAGRYPHELSGGQQQRVALARALAPKPRLLLMDEPFSNLDTELRRTLSAEVRDILKAAGMTAIMVTHDRNEAFVVSDRLGVLDNGRLQQWDTPERIYHQPATPTVASFVGDGTFVDAVAKDGHRLETEAGPLVVAERHWTPGARLTLFVRPEELVEDTGGVEAEIVSKAFIGTQTRYRFRLPNGRCIEGLFRSDKRFVVGDRIRLAIRTDQPVSFPAAGDPGPPSRREIETAEAVYGDVEA